MTGVQFFRNITDLPVIIARMMDNYDGEKDDHISGSIWNDRFGYPSGMTADNRKGISFADAVTAIGMYIKGLTTDAYKKFCKDFGIDSIDSNGIVSQYDDNGQLAVQKEYDENGNLIKETFYQNGKINSTSEYNAQGKKIKNITYDAKGKVSIVTEYDTDGYPYKDTAYNPDGSVKYIRIDEFKNGENTKATFYNADGKKDHEIMFYEDDSKTITYFDPDSGRRSFVEEVDTEDFVTLRTYYNPKTGIIRKKEEFTKDGYCNMTIYDYVGKKFYEAKVDTLAALLPDGEVGASAQEGQGDCYLMASINAIRQTDGGQEYLKSLIKKNGNDYVVTLPGAKIAAKSLLKDDRINPDKMYITGTYKFTKQEVRDLLLKAGNRYSKDDGDVILLEAAFEKYREEVAKTMDENDIETNVDKAGQQTGSNKDNILDGGRSYDAIFILTGQQSEFYVSTTDPRITSQHDLEVENPKKNNKSFFLNFRGKKDNSSHVKAEDIDTDQEHDGNEISKMHSSIQDLREMLKKIRGKKIRNYIATCSFRDADNGGLAYTVKEVNNDNVILINPWYPDKIITMDMDEFLSKVSSLAISALPKKVA